MLKEASKRAAADKALKRGSKTFRYFCKACETNRMHSSRTARCVTCQRRSNAKKTEKRRRDPEARERHNRTSRKWSREHLGKSRESAAAAEWRRATKGQMHAWYPIEREAIQAIYAGLIEVEGFKKFRQEGDHLIAKRAKGKIDGKLRVVATGLHTYANIGPLPTQLNRDKRSSFDPERCRFQRAANRFPGGAFDPQPTGEEQANMQAVSDEYGVTMQESRMTLRRYLDQLACAYEKHVSETFGIEITVDPAWCACRALPDVNTPRPSLKLSFEDEPDEETVQAFMCIAREENTANTD